MTLPYPNWEDKTQMIAEVVLKSQGLLLEPNVNLVAKPLEPMPPLERLFDGEKFEGIRNVSLRQPGAHAHL